MPGGGIYQRYRDLQTYVGWTEADAERVRRIAPLIADSFTDIVEAFYREIDLHAEARKVITGGPEQVARLKQTLHVWLTELLGGRYDAEYVDRRWRVGLRHVEIGLEQIYTNAALSRVRQGLTARLMQTWSGTSDDLLQLTLSLNRLLDLDLAIIEDAYHYEYQRRRSQIDRLATIGQVAGGIAHELRNPLNVIKTSVYYLLHAKLSTPEKRAEHMERIERQVSIADGVITALNDFARLPIPTLQNLSLEPCLREVLEAVPLGESIAVALDVPTSVPEVLGDVRQLKIVFANLIRNARDAMPDGGRLGLSARRGEADQVDVVVSDTGVGIKPEDLPRVSEPLYSTKARGIGLGLAISRAIVEKHQGRLQVASEPGRGSQFTVTLAAAVSTSTS